MDSWLDSWLCFRSHLECIARRVCCVSAGYSGVFNEIGDRFGRFLGRVHADDGCRPDFGGVRGPGLPRDHGLLGRGLGMTVNTAALLRIADIIDAIPDDRWKSGDIDAGCETVRLTEIEQVLLFSRAGYINRPVSQKDVSDRLRQYAKSQLGKGKRNGDQ